jgi:hypothetical protein
MFAFWFAFKAIVNLVAETKSINVNSSNQGGSILPACPTAIVDALGRMALSRRGAIDSVRGENQTLIVTVANSDGR